MARAMQTPRKRTVDQRRLPQRAASASSSSANVAVKSEPADNAPVPMGAPASTASPSRSRRRVAVVDDDEDDDQDQEQEHQEDDEDVLHFEEDVDGNEMHDDASPQDQDASADLDAVADMQLDDDSDNDNRNNNYGNDEQIQDDDDAQLTDNDLDDPIVNEVDVFLSTTHADNLYLMQFPTRPVPFTPEAFPRTGRIKPKTKKMQLDLSLEPDGDHYDRHQAEKFGQGLDKKPLMTAYDYIAGDHNAAGDGIGNNADSGPRPWLETMKLESKIVPIYAQYMVGYLVHNQDNSDQSVHDSGRNPTSSALHLKPLSMVLQLRPVLDYVDRINEKEKSASQKIMYEERKEISGVEEEAKVIQVMVRDSEDKEAARKASIAELQRKTENEPWVPFEVFAPNHRDSNYYRNLLIDSSPESIEFSSSPSDYLNIITPLVPGHNEGDASAISGHSNTVMGSSNNNSSGRPDLRKNVARPGQCLTQMLRLPLAERLKSLFISAHVIDFPTIKKLVASDVSDIDLIQALVDVAVLIHGVWVVRSEFLYTGRPFDARRYLLMLLLDQDYVTRAEFVNITHLPLNMAAGMLHEVADLEPGHGWRLKLLPDTDFTHMYPDIVEDQIAVVHKEGLQSYDAMRPPERPKSRRNSLQSQTQSNASSATSSNPKTINARHTSSSASSSLPPSSSTSSSVRSATLTTPPLSALSNGPRVLAQVKLEPGLGVNDQIQHLILQLLKNDGVCSREYVVNSILVHRDRNKHISQDISSKAITKTLTEICESINDVYVLKPSTGNIANDTFRNATIACFRRLDRVKKVDVTEAYDLLIGDAAKAAAPASSTSMPSTNGRGSRSNSAQQHASQIPPIPSGTLYTKLMQEIAVAEKGSGTWTLKVSPPAPLLD